jgi:hypothetical protein
LLDQLVQGCQTNGLELISVVPVSAVLHHQLAQLPLEKDEVTLLAAETGGSTSVVAGRGDGQLLLERTLPHTWNGSADRLAADLNHTIFLLTQQYGLKLTDVMWVFGPEARERAAALEEELQLLVTISPEAYQPFYWATEVLKLRPGRTPNFLRGRLPQGRRWREFAEAVGVCAALLVLAAAAGAGSVWQGRQETAKMERLRQRAAQLQARRQHLQQRNAPLTEDQPVPNLALAGQPDPVPVWFLGYLSEVMPPELTATYVHLVSETNAWTVQMATTWEADHSGQGAMPPEIAEALARLRTQLSNGPFHLQPLSASVREPSGRPEPGPQSAADPLLIEGVIQ